MPGEIQHLVRIPVSVVLTETIYKALQALARAEKMTLDEEISSLIAWGMYPNIEVCEGMTGDERQALLGMLKAHGES